MRYIVTGLITLIFGQSAGAEDGRLNTLLNQDEIWKAHTQVELKHTEMKGDDAELAGLSIGWTMNDTWTIGPVGYVMFTDIEPQGSKDAIIDDLRLWYAGLRGEYTWHPDQIVHWNCHLLVGGGEAEANVGQASDRTKEESRFFIIEPGLNLVMRVYEFMEIGIGAGYSWIMDTDLDSVSDGDLSEFNGKIFIRLKEL